MADDEDGRTLLGRSVIAVGRREGRKDRSTEGWRTVKRGAAQLAMCATEERKDKGAVMHVRSCRAFSRQLLISSTSVRKKKKKKSRNCRLRPVKRSTLNSSSPWRGRTGGERETTATRNEVKPPSSKHVIPGITMIIKKKNNSDGRVYGGKSSRLETLLSASLLRY